MDERDGPSVSNSAKMQSSEGESSSTGRKDGDQSPKVPSFTAKPETFLQRAQKFNNLGNLYFKTGKYYAAVARYNKAIDICPKKSTEALAISYQNRAAAYEQLENYSAVKTDCTKALELNPKYTKALLRRSRALKQLGNLEAALKDINIACIYEDFSNEVSLFMEDEIFEQLLEQHVQENLANKKFIMPHRYWIKRYIASFTKDPVLSRLQHLENVPEFFKKPLQALKNEKYDDVIPLCTEIIEKSDFDQLPSSKLEVVLLRATFYFISGDYDAAIQDFESIFTSGNVSVDMRINVLVKRANVYMQLQIPEMAFIDFKLAINIDPTCSDIYYNRGEANYALARIDDAKRDYEKAVEYNSNFGMAYMQKYRMDYISAIQFEDVRSLKTIVRDFQRAFEKKTFENLTERTHYYLLCAQMMSKTQQYRKADSYMVKAIKKDPKNTIIHVRRSLVQYQWKGNIDKTVKYIRKAIESDEKEFFPYAVLGAIEAERGNLEEAIKLFEKASVLCCTSRELTYIYKLRNTVKLQLDIQNQLGYIPQLLRSFSSSTDIQDAEELDEQISIDSDWISSRFFSKYSCRCNAPFSSANKETLLQRAQKYKNTGNSYFKVEEYDAAIIQYSKAINICPKENVDDLAIFYQNRAAAYEQLKNYNAVKADCTRALELNPKYTKASLRRARALKQLEDLKASSEDIFTTCIREVKQHAQKNLTNKKFLMPSKRFMEAYIRSFSVDPIFSKLQHQENVPEFFKKPFQALKDEKYDDVIPLCTEVIKRPEFDTLPSSKLEVLLLRATFYCLLVDYDAAIKDFESVLTSKDASDNMRINILIKIAEIYMDFENPEMAFKNYELAIDINSSCSDIYSHRARANLSLDRINEAKRDFEKALQYNPNIRTYLDMELMRATEMEFSSSDNEFSSTESEDSVQSFEVPSFVEPKTSLQRAQKCKNTGNGYFEMKKYDEAIAQYSEAIDICPKENVEDLAIFYQNRAAAYEKLKQYSAVKADCTKALELNPRYTKALLRRSRALEQIGDLNAALDDVTSVCILQGSSEQTFSSLASSILDKLVEQYIEKKWLNKKFSVRKHFIEMYVMSFSKDPVFAKLKHPENIPEFLKKPLQALKDAKYDDVIPLCTRVINNPKFNSLPPSKLELLLLLRATFYMVFGKFYDAINDFERILISNDVSVDVRINALIKKGILCGQIGSPQITAVDFELAIMISDVSNYSDIYYHRGQIKLLMHKIDEAKHDFEKAVEYNPNFSAAYIQKCYLDYYSAISSKNIRLVIMAIENFERLSEKYPNPPECTCCWIIYAKMMIDIEQYQRADTYFVRTIEKDPENVAVYVQRGLLQLLWNGNVAKTMEYINKALELDKNCRLAYEALGILQTRGGNLEEAMRFFDKALLCCRTYMQILRLHVLRYIAKIYFSSLKPEDYRGKDLILILLRNCSIHYGSD